MKYITRTYLERQFISLAVRIKKRFAEKKEVEELKEETSRSIKELDEAVNGFTERLESGECKGETGDPGPPGPKGEPGVPGVSDWSGIENKPDTFTPPAATASTRGGIKTGFTTNNANRNFALSTSEEKAYTNLPAGGSGTYGVVKTANNLTSTATSGTALAAAQGKVLNEKITFKSLSATGTNTIATASVFDSYKEIVLKVTAKMGSSYFSYTAVILTSSVGLGDGEDFFMGDYANNGTHAFIRVRVSRTAAQIINVNISGTDMTSSASLQLFYR